MRLGMGKEPEFEEDMKEQIGKIQKAANYSMLLALGCLLYSGVEGFSFVLWRINKLDPGEFIEIFNESERTPQF